MTLEIERIVDVLKKSPFLTAPKCSKEQVSHKYASVLRG